MVPLLSARQGVDLTAVALREAGEVPTQGESEETPLETTRWL